VVVRNDLFVYALKSAPDVLMAQYKHFGQVSSFRHLQSCSCPNAHLQLGVLGWCSEFSELIDELKEFGSLGMFPRTRNKAHTNIT
jgi:hypothetical protein